MRRVKIQVFSHISGRVEIIDCEDYEIKSTCNATYVNAITKSTEIVIIPWNRVKQINILNNESEEK